MNLIALYPIISLFFILSVGIFVLYKSKGLLGNLFFLITVVFSVWMYGSFKLFTVTSDELIIWWDRFIYFGVVFMPALQYHFSLVQTKVTNKRKLLLIVAYILSFTFLLLSRTDLFINEVFRYKWGVHSIAQPFHHFFLAFFFFYIFALLFNYLIELRNNNNRVEVKKLKIVIVSFAILNLVGGVGYLPAYKIGIYSPISMLAPLIFTVLISYSILRYRFLDIGVVIKRSLIFTLLVLFITSIYSVSAFLISNYVQNIIGNSSIIIPGIITGIIVAIGFEPIKKFLTNTTDSFLFKGEYKMDELLSQLSQDFSSTLELDSILAKSSNDLMSAFRVKGISVYLFEKNELAYRERYFAGVHTPPISISRIVVEDYLKHLQAYGLRNNALVTEELKRLNVIQDPSFVSMIQMMEENSVSVTVPLFIKDDLIGFYFLDEKKSGDTFTTQDIQVLEIMSGQAATAIENALLYEEQKKFAEKLQDEVNLATKELRSANKELKKLDKAKSEFISIASHQLRTPMTVIKGYISMIKDGDFGVFGEKLNKPLESVLQSTNRLLSLIEDLLNVSRIESGRMQYEFEKTSFQKIVENVFEDLKSYAKNRKLEFTYHGPKEKLPVIIIDAKKIREVVMNLMDNAIKYTSTGRIDVCLEPKNGEIVYRVEDTGRGMLKEDIGKLFKKFSRVGGSALVHTEGTGLGLYIAKQIIMKHNGKIWAESNGEGLGSTFAIALKVKNTKLEIELEKQLKIEKTLADEAEAQKNEKVYKEDTIDLANKPKIQKE